MPPSRLILYWKRLRLPFFIGEVYNSKENLNPQYISLQKPSFIVLSYAPEKDGGIDKAPMIETWQRVTEKVNSWTLE